MNELTGRDLDKAIAALLGWTVYSYMADSVDYFMAVAPHDGFYSIDDFKFLISLGGQYAKRKSEDEAWGDATEYSADANAQLAVCAERGWTLIYDAEGAQIIVPCMNPDREKHYVAYHEDAEDVMWQEAGARALLAALTAETDDAR